MFLLLKYKYYVLNRKSPPNMNRTKEYIKLVNSSFVPQLGSQQTSIFLDNLFEIEKNIKSEIFDILKSKYESYNIRKKIQKVHQFIEDFKAKIKNNEYEYHNRQEQEVFENIVNILTQRINEHKLKLNKIVNKLQDEQHEQIIENSERRKEYTSVIEEEVVNSVRFREREKLNQQISEIGSIMEEIGIHVSLQEENFKRIDDLMNQNEKLVDSGIYILKKGMESISNNRSSMFKFFGFWVILILIFWFFRR